MAWQAKPTNPVSKPGRLLAIYAEFVYYDDVDGLNGKGEPNNPLHYAEFRWDTTRTNGQMQADVVAQGVLARNVKQRADQVNTNFPVATTIIPIP